MPSFVRGAPQELGPPDTERAASPATGGPGRLGRDGAGRGWREAAGRGLPGPPGSTGTIHLLLTSGLGLTCPPSFSPSSRPTEEGHSLGTGGTALLLLPVGEAGRPEASAGGRGWGWAWFWCLRLLPEPQA